MIGDFSIVITDVFALKHVTHGDFKVARIFSPGAGISVCGKARSSQRSPVRKLGARRLEQAFAIHGDSIGR